MSSTGLWAQDQGSMSEEDGVSSSQPPELEDKSSQAKTVKIGIDMLLSRFEDDAVRPLGSITGLVLVLLGLVLLLGLVQASDMFPLWLQEVMPRLMLVLTGMLLALVLVLALVPVQTLHRIMNFCRACMHRHGGRLLKWGPHRIMNFCRACLHGHGGRLVKWGPHEWVLDSGAWNHHTSNLALLLEGGYFQSHELDNKDAPSSGDDATAPPVQGRRSVRTDCFDFPGVHYVVGDDTRNVVSVSQLARDHGLVTVFEPTSCHVKEKKTGKIVGKGRLRNGMYILDSLHIVGQHIRDGGESGGDRHDGADGGGGGNGDGDSTAEGRGGGGRDGRGGEGGTGARNQEESSGNGAARGDINEINEEGEDGDEKEMSRSHTGLFGMSRLDCIWWIVSILCIAACILHITGWEAGVTILAGFILRFWMMSTICEEEETSGPYPQELSHQEHNKRLFGLSRFDATTDPTGYHLPAGAFPASSTNAARREEFLLDSGASFHMTWNEWILIPYPKDLKDHTEPPTRRFGGIIGSIAVKTSGYLSSDKIKLDGVLLAPDSRMNLVSVGQLSIQYEVNVEMDDKGFVIKKKQGGVQIGGGKMLNNHQYVLEYFNPGGLFALSPTPDFNIFGTSVSSSASEASKEDDGAVAEPSGPEGEVAKPRKRQPNKRLFGPEWSN